MADIPIGDFVDLLAGAGARIVSIPPLPGERILHQSSANWGNVTGGILVLTNYRLVFAPWNVSQLVSVLSWAIPQLGGPDILAELTRRAGDAVGGVRVAGAVASAQPGRGASLLHPPTLIVTTSDGAQVEFGVLHSKGTPNFSGKNVEARDRFVDAINGSR